jgi:apolipoprotein N-acyltransferase
MSWLLVAIVAAMSWPLVLFLAGYLSRRFPMAAALPLAWITGEFVRKHLFTLLVESPFPWLQFGLTQSNVAVAQIADLGGVWILTGLLAAFNGTLCDFIHGRRTSIIVVAIAVCSAWIYGEWRVSERQSHDGPLVALMPVEVQPLDQRTRAVRADLLLWSECALYEPIVGSLSTTEMVARLKARAREMNTGFAVGCLRKLPAPDGTSTTNSLVLVDRTGLLLGSYDKVFLVPWQEFQPRLSLPFIPRPSADFIRGKSYETFQLHRRDCAIPFTFGASICYDTCFPESHIAQMKSASGPPDFFVASSCETVDQTGVLQRSIQIHAIFRSIECRRSIVRNVNGGLSGVIDSNGQVRTPVPDGDIGAATIVGPVPVDHRRSLYRAIGEMFPLWISLVTVTSTVGVFCWNRRMR